MAAATRPRYATRLTTSPEQFSVINGNVTRVSLGVRSAPDPDKALHFFPDFPPVFPLSPPPTHNQRVVYRTISSPRRFNASLLKASRRPSITHPPVRTRPHIYLFSKSMSKRYVCMEGINIYL